MSDHHKPASIPREGLLGVLFWSQASHVPRGSGDGSEVVESAGVPSYQTMGTLRMQVGPGLCGLEQLLKPQGEQQARLRGEDHKPRQWGGVPSLPQDSREEGHLNYDSDERGGICEQTSCWKLGLGG